VARRVVCRRVQEQKIWPQLGYGDSVGLKDQVDPDVGRVTAVTAQISAYG